VDIKSERACEGITVLSGITIFFISRIFIFYHKHRRFCPYRQDRNRVLIVIVISIIFISDKLDSHDITILDIRSFSFKHAIDKKYSSTCHSLSRYICRKSLDDDHTRLIHMRWRGITTHTDTKSIWRNTCVYRPRVDFCDSRLTVKKPSPKGTTQKSRRPRESICIFISSQVKIYSSDDRVVDSIDSMFYLAIDTRAIYPRAVIEKSTCEREGSIACVDIFAKGAKCLRIKRPNPISSRIAIIKSSELFFTIGDGLSVVHYRNRSNIISSRIHKPFKSIPPIAKSQCRSILNIVWIKRYESLRKNKPHRSS